MERREEGSCGITKVYPTSTCRFPRLKLKAFEHACIAGIYDIPIFHSIRALVTMDPSSYVLRALR